MKIDSIVAEYRRPGSLIHLSNKCVIIEMVMMHQSPNTLRLIFWELTAACNLRCIHCRAEATPQRLKEELNTRECFDFIDNVASFASPIMILTGGEPLNRPDLFDIASHASKAGLRVALATNGTLVDAEIAKKLKDAGVIRSSISIDGAKAETHDAFRGIQGSFEMALKGCKEMRDAGIELQLNMTVTKNNADEVKEVFALAKRLDAIALHLFMLVPVGCGVSIAEDQMLPAARYEKILAWLYKAGRDNPDLEVKATCAPHYYRILHARAKKEGRKPDIRTDGMAAVTKGCLAGAAVCFVGRTGDVQPCGYLPLIAGNIREKPFREIWETSQLFDSLREPVELKGKCGACEYAEVCMGCRARAYAETGDYLEEEPYCIYVPPGYRKETDGIKA